VTIRSQLPSPRCRGEHAPHSKVKIAQRSWGIPTPQAGARRCKTHRGKKEDDFNDSQTKCDVILHPFNASPHENDNDNEHLLAGKDRVEASIIYQSCLFLPPISLPPMFSHPVLPGRILVIGGGPTCLVALRNLTERGHFERVELVERRDDVGDVW